MGESYSRMQHAAPEDELLRLESAYEAITAERLKRVQVGAPAAEPTLTTGDPS